MEFSKIHHPVPLGARKVSVALGSSTQYLEVPFNIYTIWLKPVTSNLVYSLCLTRPIIKSHPEKQWVWHWARGAPKNFGVPYNIFANHFKFFSRSWGLPRVIIKSHAEEKVGVARN